MPKKETFHSFDRSVEDFIKAVYVLEQGLHDETARVSTNALRDALDITAPSVTDMAKRMVKDGIVDYRKYHGVLLTEKGRKRALNILRNHRLLELYLVQELGYELHEVHAEADNLEHAVSERFIEAIAEKLGHPEFDPHGDPIPQVDGTIANRDLCALSEIPLQTPARVSRLVSSDADILQHTLDRGFSLDAKVVVTARDPFDGPITVRIGSDETIIGHNIAERILVELIN